MESHRPAGSHRTTILVLVIILIGVLGAGYYFAPRFESNAPQIAVTPDTDILGEVPLEIMVTDQGSGLKSVTATLSAGGPEQTLTSEQYSQPVGEKKISVLASKISGLKE